MLAKTLLILCCLLLGATGKEHFAAFHKFAFLQGNNGTNTTGTPAPGTPAPGTPAPGTGYYTTGPCADLLKRNPDLFSPVTANNSNNNNNNSNNTGPPPACMTDPIFVASLLGTKQCFVEQCTCLNGTMVPGFTNASDPTCSYPNGIQIFPSCRNDCLSKYYACTGYWRDQMLNSPCVTDSMRTTTLQTVNDMCLVSTCLTTYMMNAFNKSLPLCTDTEINKQCGMKFDGTTYVPGDATASPPTPPPPTVTPSPEMNQLCNSAIEALVTGCPGLAAFANVSDSPTKAQLSSICPCLTPTMQSKFAMEYFSVQMYCDNTVQRGISVMADIMCLQNAKKDKYCGEEFGRISQTVSALSDFFSGERALSPLLLDQKVINATCTECFDLVLVGVYTLFGDLVASMSSDMCNENCQQQTAEAAESLMALSAASVLCIDNDNQEQKATDPYCFPYFYNNLRTVGKTCGNFKTENDCYQKGNSECVYFKGKCTAVGTVPLVAYGNWIYPPFSTLDKFCVNSCFFTTQFGMLEIAAVINEIEMIPGGSNTQTGSNDTQKLQQGMDIFGEVAEFICLSNKKDFCVVLLEELSTRPEPPKGCNISSWMTDSPQCSTECAASMKVEVEKGGCCWGSMSELQKKVDPTYQQLYNYAGVATACNFTLASSCPLYDSTPVPVSTTVSGSCAWINADKNNLEQLKNATAKQLGVNAVSLKGFAVTELSGTPCPKSRTARRMRGQQGGPTLKAGFNVVARDNKTAQRIAASANASAITIPTVAKQAATIATVAQNKVVASNAPTLKPTPAPPGKATTAPPQGTVAGSKIPTATPAAGSLPACGPGCQAAVVIGVVVGLTFVISLGCALTLYCRGGSQKGVSGDNQPLTLPPQQYPPQQFGQSALPAV